MSADSSLRNHRTASTAHSRQAEASENKRKRRRERDEAERAEAARLGISVEELRTRKARETASLRTPSRTVSVSPTKVVQPVLRPSADGYSPWSRSGIYDR